MTSRELAEVMLFGLLVGVMAYFALLHVFAFVNSLY